MFAFVLSVGLLLASASGFNNWAEPCHNGECTYDDVQGSMSGSLRITGSPSSISDLTAASGWVTLSCSSDQASQNIRVVCQGDDPGCDHVFLNGAVGTVVRLPDDCSPMPFARISRAWDHEDQSIVPSKRRLIYRRDGSQPVVKAFSIDTNFAAVDASQNGNVFFSVSGSCNSSVYDASSGIPLRKRASSILPLIGSIFTDAVDEIKVFNNTLFEGVPTFSFNETVVIFQQSLTCPSKSDSHVSVDAGATATVSVLGHATLNYSVAAAGTVVPPVLSQLEVGTSLDSSATGVLSVDTSLEGTVSSGSIPVFGIGIPGLHFPGIFSVGPTFNISAVVSATLEADLNTDLSLGLGISNASAFIPSLVSPTGSFQWGTPNFNLSVDPTATTDANLTAHLIPAITYGISFFDGEIEGAVDLSFDTSMTLELALIAGATAGTSQNATSQLGGCVNLIGGIDLTIGAVGDLLSFIDAQDNTPIFQQDFNLFQKCFGNSTNLPRSLDLDTVKPILSKRDSLRCPTAGVGAPTPLVNQTV